MSKDLDLNIHNFRHISVSKIELYSSFYRPQRSCGKVMFLHLSVILFTRGGGGWQEMATTADRTHPTGMHSCSR